MDFDEAVQRVGGGGGFYWGCCAAVERLGSALAKGRWYVEVIRVGGAEEQREEE